MGWAAIVTVVFLAPNTYYVYHSFSVFQSPYREIASAGVSLIIAGGILIYTLRKNFKVAKYYTLFEVSISTYYYIRTIGFDWGLIPALGFTLILPISVYYYSREFDNEGEDLKDKYNRLWKRWRETTSDHKIDLEKLHKANALIDEHQKASVNYIAHCEEKFSQIQQECAHWMSENERAITGWTTDVGLRDERIEELESQVESHIDYSQNNLLPCIENLKKQLLEYYDKNKSVFDLLEKSKQDFEKFKETSLHEKSLLIADHETEIEKLKAELNMWSEGGTILPLRPEYGGPKHSDESEEITSDIKPEPLKLKNYQQPKVDKKTPVASSKKAAPKTRSERGQ